MTVMGGVLIVLVTLAVGMGMGWFLGNAHGQVVVTRDLVQTYKHLLDYGRTTKPVAAVSERPATVEEIASVRISETAKDNLTEYLARESGQSSERARAEAERLLANYETWGQAPGGNT
jgi:hypothetical protein